jgi:hypothetical protein
LEILHASRYGNVSCPTEIVLPPGVKFTTLENGLIIIVREDHSAPVVSAQAWCMAGSIHEGRWLGAGLSHVLEHMLFKGTTTRPGSRIDQEVQEAGGYMNAYTSFDRTVYHIDVPNTGATTAIDILCDIMQHATCRRMNWRRKWTSSAAKWTWARMIPAAAPAAGCLRPPTPKARIVSPSSAIPTFSTNQAGGHPQLLHGKIRAEQRAFMWCGRHQER